MILSAVASMTFVVGTFLIGWGGDWFPIWLWPGLGVAALANRAGLRDPDYMKYWLIFYGVDILFWAALFYGLATVYVRRKTRPLNRA